MADLMNVLMEARNGALAVKLSRDFTKLVEGCVQTNQKGEMHIKLVLLPSKTDDGAIQISISSDTKLKVPEFGVGSALFFVDDENNLTRTDPRQEALFESEQAEKEIKRG